MGSGAIIHLYKWPHSFLLKRAYRRAERLTAALHLLTNHVPFQEPSRVEIRRVGVQLLSNLLDLRDEMRVSTSPAFRAVQASVRELISLVRVLSTSGYISLQNASIVVETLDELGNFLTVSQRSTLSESVTFSKDELLGTEGSGMSLMPVRKSASETDKSQVQGRRMGQIIKDRKSIKDISRTDDKGQHIEQALDRRGLAILDILRSQGVIGIKDIASNLPEYSEKMIQRELVRLVSLNRVKKIGFKRWSKYAFTQ